MAKRPSIFQFCLCGLFPRVQPDSLSDSGSKGTKEPDIEIKANPTSTGAQPPVNTQEAEKIRKLCPRFRILIMGRANSGKTTIIRKMCDATDEPVVHDENGNELPAAVLEEAKAKRGIHNIRLEITYLSNPHFVFHDSMGFESGSEEEVGIVRDFIDDKLAKTELRHRIHAIWYCVPTGVDRVGFKSELDFFEKNTGDIPVILLFTKWDGQIKQAYNMLRYREKRAMEVARLEAPKLAREILDTQYLPLFQKAPYPPASYTVLGDMNLSTTSCSELAAKTEAALDNHVLRRLFVRVQTHNIQICVKGAMSEVFRTSDIWDPSTPYNSVISSVMSFFPHIFVIVLRLSIAWEQAQDYASFEYETLYLSDEEKVALPIRLAETGIIQVLEPVVAHSEETFSSHFLRILNIIISAAVIGARSFNLKQPDQPVKDTVQPALTEYLASPKRQAVAEAIATTFSQDQGLSSAEITEDRRMAVLDELQRICLSNLLD